MMTIFVIAAGITHLHRSHHHATHHQKPKPAVHAPVTVAPKPTTVTIEVTRHPDPAVVAKLATEKSPANTAPVDDTLADNMLPATAPVPKPIAVSSALTKQPNVVTVSSDEILCSLTVSDMDPGQVLRQLSAMTGVNLILMTKAETKLTISMNKVPLAEMLRHICAISDLNYLKVGSTYILATAEKLKTSYPIEWAASGREKPQAPVEAKDEVVTEIYASSFVTSGELARALGKAFKEADVALVAGPAPMSPAIASQDGAKATGTSTAVLAPKDGNDPNSKTLVITGKRSAVEAALLLAKQLDRPRKQVGILVTIHDISNDALRDVGTTWNFGDTTFQESQGKGINLGNITRTPLSVAATLAALEKTGASKLLARPNISVLDGERAFVLIGDRISYPVLVGYSQINAPIFSKEEERVGIYLQVSASISEDGTVTLSLYPQVSTITGYLSVNGASYPQVSTREAQTTLRVGSGQTIVLGGLLRDEDITEMEKVPLLSKIPFIGEIFKHRKVTKTKSQVIITVTPTVIDLAK